jgi:hypothetical protein
MKTTRIFILRNFLFVLATLFFLSNPRANAQSAASVQTAGAPSSSAQAAATNAPIIKPVPRVIQQIDDNNLVTLHGSVHPLARAGFDQGLVADSRPMPHMLLVLQRSADQEATLRSLLDGQQAKGTANYHAWLTPAQFGQQFGVAGEDIQQVASWLAGKGFTGIKSSNSGMFIQFDGTAGLVRTAFHTEIHNVLVNGQVHIANLSDPQIPAALAPVIAKIHSLHDFRAKSAMHMSKALEQLKTNLGSGSGSGVSPHFTAPNPCGGTSEPTCIYAVGPGDLATIYNIPSTVAGSPAGQGQTVAIVADSNVTISDINQFGAAFGIPNLTNFSTSNIVVNGPDPGIQPPDDGEATLDVDMVGSVAPNANILLVVNAGTVTGELALSSPTQGTDQSALYIVDNNLAPVMSESFGECEQGVDTAFYSTIWEQAAAQGISVFVSTGDSGADSCEDGETVATGEETGTTLTINGIASTPFNVAVGGTDFNDAANPTTYWNTTNTGSGLGSAKSYIPEIPWNDSCAATATVGSLNTCATETPNSDGLDLTGGSGGQSICGLQDISTSECTGGYPKPSWQTGTGVPADGVRDIPDVSLYASVNSPSNHFYVLCLADSGSQVPGPCNFTGTPAYNFSGVGGTSASTPAWAGILALVNQSEVAAGRGGRQGNANYTLYKLAAAQNSSPGTSACNSTGATAPAGTCTLNDITIGNNSVECEAGAPNCSNQTTSGFGVLTEPTGSGEPFAANTPAWQATAGYDLATGLGTPNVTNLIANWATVTTSLKSATPAITASTPATLTTSGVTHGSTATFTISVTSGSGTPTGDVSLIAEPPGFAQVGLGFGTLSNGTVTITTTMLPGDDTTGAGTPYPVIAHYAGDGNFGPADSAPVNVTVNRENSTTTETLSQEDLVTGALTTTSSVEYGTEYIMVVDVIGATAGQVCSNANPNPITQIPTVPCPTGTITLKDNGQPLNDFVQTGANNTNTSTVGNLGFVEDLLISLGGGSNGIVASYSGDNSYNPSTSANGAFTVTPGSTQTVVGLTGEPPTAVPAGTTVALVATVNTADVQLCNGSPCASFSNGAGPTGTVTFSSCGTASSCTVPVVPSAFNTSTGAAAFGTATLTTSFSTAGSQTITATYSGDANYQPCTANGSPSTPAPGCSFTSLAVTVTGSAGTASKLVFISEPSNVPAGVAISPAVQVAIEDVNGNIVSSATNPVTIAIGTNPGSGTLGGTVTATPASGIATFSNLAISAAGVGYTLTATATGSPALTAATSTAFTVTAQPAKLAFIVPPSTALAGAAIIPAVQVAIEDSNGNVVTGASANVTVAIGTNPGSGTLGGPATTVATSGGIATFNNLTISAAGTGYTLTASAAGLTSATSPAFNITAAPLTASFSLASTAVTLSSATGAAVGSTITVTPSNGFTGTVTVTATAASLPPGVTCPNSPLAIDVTGTSAVTGTLNCQVLATSTTLSAFNRREERVLDAKALAPAATNRNTPPNGAGSAKGWWALSASTGLAAIFFVFLPGGRKRLHAALGLGLVCLLAFTLGCNGVSGNSGGGGLTTTTTAIQVTNGTAGRIASGTAFTFTVTVTGGTPTGNVELFDNGTMIGTAVAVSSGTASLTAPSTLAVGTHQISAHYLGDSTTDPSESGTLDLTVTGSTTVVITTTPTATPAASPITVTVE